MDCTPTKKGFRRLQALLWFYEGKTYQEIAALSHFSERQILRYMQAFCEKLQSWQKDESIDLWFSDESGIEGDPRPLRQWTEIGSIRTSLICASTFATMCLEPHARRMGDSAPCSSTTVIARRSRPSSTPWPRRTHPWPAAALCW